MTDVLLMDIDEADVKQAIRETDEVVSRAVAYANGVEEGRRQAGAATLQTMLVANAPPVPAWFRPVCLPPPPAMPDIASLSPRVRESIDSVVEVELGELSSERQVTFTSLERIAAIALGGLTADELEERILWQWRLENYREAVEEYEETLERERMAQWPWHWAEMVMARQPFPAREAAK